MLFLGERVPKGKQKGDSVIVQTGTAYGSVCFAGRVPLVSGFNGKGKPGPTLEKKTGLSSILRPRFGQTMFSSY